MPATISLSEDFINEALKRFLPTTIPELKLIIESEYIVAQLPISIIGFKVNPSAAFRIVSFKWGKTEKIFVLELIKTSILDARPIMSYVKKYLPEFISIKDTFLIIDLNKIESVKEQLDNPMISHFKLQKMGTNKGNLNLTFELEPINAV